MEKKQVEQEKLRLVVFSSAKELGRSIDKYLLNRHGLNQNESTFILPIKESFFSDGHLKVELESTVRGMDLYLLTDIGNYSLTYNMHGFSNHTSPNDLLMQLKDGIGACNSHARSINLIMPLLYAGRQHRRITRENLLCGQTLHELDLNHRTKSIITFDAHDPGVEHAVFDTEFDNFYATNVILKDFIDDLSVEDLKDLVFVAPDNGATGRRNVYLNSFAHKEVRRSAGSFVKQRDYNHFENGKYPVIAHDYSGDADLEGKTAIVSDDMIASGGSMFDVIDELHKRKVKSIYVMVTFALFTEGIDKFQDYYDRGLFQGIYTTNLSYIPEEMKAQEWLHVCDCSKMMADIIYNLHNDQSISEILRDKSYPVKLLERKFRDGRL